jgi:hypothetical protein
LINAASGVWHKFFPLGGSHSIAPSIGGIGVSPVQAQAKACGYHTLPFDCRKRKKLLRFLQNSALTIIVILSVANNLIFSDG